MNMLINRPIRLSTPWITQDERHMVHKQYLFSCNSWINLVIIYNYRMLNRIKQGFKQVITKGVQDQSQVKKRNIDISFLNPKELEQYKQNFQQIQNNMRELSELISNNKTELHLFIQEQKKDKVQKAKELTEDEQIYTLIEDVEEMRAQVEQVHRKLDRIVNTNKEINDRVKSLGSGETPEKVKEMQELQKRYEIQIKNLQMNQQNERQMANTMKQQVQLLSKETKNLQEKTLKLQKELTEKTNLVTNLRQQKTMLLQMRNIESSSNNPQVEKLKNQLIESQKKLSIQRTKLQQKEKEIESLKKKMEQDRDSLQKIADQLKQKQLKSKKIIDKYQRSKTQIRKYREQKTQFIKKLNIEIASLTDKIQKIELENQTLSARLKQLSERNEKMELEITKNENKSLQLESIRYELKQIRQEQIDLSGKLQEKEYDNEQLRSQVESLQSKRKSLLQALEKPINHQMKTLDKIIRALQKLYKEYIDVVFTQGNIIGFQTKISYILSNVIEIKEDLKL